MRWRMIGNRGNMTFRDEPVLQIVDMLKVTPDKGGKPVTPQSLLPKLQKI